jgi:hypothetical protein
MDGHARANRQKASGIAAKGMILRVHLLPALDHKWLDTIKSEDVQRLKRNLEVKSPKTVNNILAVLSVVLKKALEWEEIDRMPCAMKLLTATKRSTRFHDSTSTSDWSKRRGCSISPPISSCCWAVRRDCDAARWSRSNEAKSIS